MIAPPLEAVVAKDRDKSAGVAGGDIEGSCLTPFAGHGEEGHANEAGHVVCPCRKTACEQAPAVTAITLVAVRGGSCGDAGAAGT